MDHESHTLTDHTGDVACCSGVGGISFAQSLLFTFLAFTFFSTSFMCVRSLLRNNFHRFAEMTVVVQCDLTSRVISVLHSIIVVPGLVVGVICMKWGSHYEPLSDVSFLQGLLCISLGYFFYDTILLLLFQQPNWIVFAFHHVVSSTPYIIYLFGTSCSYGLFVLACFMLVEATNLPLHAGTTLEENGMEDTYAFSVALYSTFFLWIIFRLINPTMLVIILHEYIIPSLPPAGVTCLIPGVLCAYLINFFCYGVFVMLCKEVVLHWRKSQNAGVVFSIDSANNGGSSSGGGGDGGSESNGGVHRNTSTAVDEGTPCGLNEKSHHVHMHGEDDKAVAQLGTRSGETRRVETAWAMKTHAGGMPPV